MKGCLPLSGPRTRIMRLVRGGRGVTLTDLQGETGLSHHAVRHHVARLEASGFIRVHKHAGTAYFFPPTMSEDEAQRRAQWRHDATLRFIIQRLQRGPTDRTTLDHEIRNVLGLTRMGSWKALERAITSGWIRERDGILAVLVTSPP